ncbi:MAG: peptidoglycan DD-metalloendopeptidase family protein [Pseudomonadota bacterium]
MAHVVALNRFICLLSLFAVLAGCSFDWDEPQPGARRYAGGQYTIKAGDSLYGIAAKLGLDHRQLAQWNGIDDPTRIYPGQVLRLTPPKRAALSKPIPRRPPPKRVAGWRWPTDGKMVSAFDMSSQTARSGIMIAGRQGQPVLAAAPGEVVYSGSGLKAYGKLVIIQHNEDVLSAYGYNAALLVNEGDRVVAGQQIATMGETAAQRPRLHFEIRERGDPVDPLPLLPRR